MRSSFFDVAIIGAGPAGAVAARVLANAGLGVVIWERQSLPRYKTCGGGIVARAWSRLGMKDAVCERGIAGIDLHGSDGALLASVRRPRPIVHMVMRSSLDLDWLVARSAVEAGAELWERTELRRLRRRNGGLVLTGPRGDLFARFVIAAYGAGGPTARLAGWGPAAAGVPAIEAEVEVLPETDAAARFDLRVPAGGYAWCFPKRRHLSVGVLSRAKPAPSLPAELRAYLRRLGVGGDARVEAHGFRIPDKARSVLARGRVLLAGDAAGLADPLTLEGISNAVQSGEAAARAILDNASCPGAVERGYHALLGDVLRESSAGRLLARVLYSRRPVVDRLLARHGARVAERLTDVFTGQDTLRATLRRALIPRVLRR